MRKLEREEAAKHMGAEARRSSECESGGEEKPWRNHLSQKLFQVDQPVHVCPELSERKCRALEESAMRAVLIPHISWTLEGL